MSLATPVTPNNCFPPTTLPGQTRPTSPGSPATAWWRRSLSRRVASGIIGAGVLGCAAGIEIARAWTDAPQLGVEAERVVGGAVVALFVTAALGLLTRASMLTSVAVAAVFALAAHGGTLVLEGELVGSLFLGIAPIVALLAHVTFAVDDGIESTAAREAFMRARMLALWTTTSRRRTARAAPLAASPTPLAMRASQVTIIDAWVKTPSSSSLGSETPRSCASSA